MATSTIKNDELARLVNERIHAKRKLVQASGAARRAWRVLEEAREQRPDVTKQQNRYRRAVTRRSVAVANLLACTNFLQCYVKTAAGIPSPWHPSAIVEFNDDGDFEIAYGNVDKGVDNPVTDDFDGFCTLTRLSDGQWACQYWRTPSTTL